MLIEILKNNDIIPIELRDQLLLNEGIFDFDYLTFSIDNEEIEIAADDIMDFSEGNPFGTP